jgi:hypothetical protein
MLFSMMSSAVCAEALRTGTSNNTARANPADATFMDLFSLPLSYGRLRGSVERQVCG